MVLRLQDLLVDTVFQLRGLCRTLVCIIVHGNGVVHHWSGQ